MTTFLGVGTIEFVYLLFFIIGLFYLFIKIKHSFLELLFFVGGTLSPYSISIIPFRQNFLNIYSVYSNSDILNFFYFWDGAFLAPVYLLAIVVVIKNGFNLCREHEFFLRLIALVTFFSTAPLFYSYFYHYTELDRLLLFFLPLKSFVIFLAFFASVNAILEKIEIDFFVRSMLGFYFLYVIIISMLIAFDIPDWMVWQKYGFKYKFLDQADQFLIFIFMIFAVSTFRNDFIFIFETLILMVLLFLSGAKGVIYYCVSCAFVFCFSRLKFGYNLCCFLFFCFIFMSWMISIFIGYWGLDVSIYTRFHQVQQLLMNYVEDPLLMLWGMGAQKSYYFYTDPVLYDAGAYFSGEDQSSYRIAFQMPFLDFLRTSGFVIGFGLLFFVSLLLSNFFFRGARSVSDRDVQSLALAASFYFLMFGFMSYPFWGGKQAMGAALFAVILKKKSFGFYRSVEATS